MKKLLVLAVLAVLGVSILSACGRGDERRLYLFNWGYFMDTSIFDDFYEEYGIRVVHQTYYSNLMMYARAITMGQSYDLIIPSDYMIERLILEGHLSPINWDNIPNRQYVDPMFMGMPFDTGNRYSVPYMWGTMGLLYNPDMVGDRVVDSWSILWEEEFAGQVFLYNSERCTITVALHMLGHSANTRDISHFDAARDALIQQRQLGTVLLGDEMVDRMIANERAFGVIYAGGAIRAMRGNDSLRFVIPNEGAQLFLNSLVIPATSPRQEYAEKFINFLLRPEIGLRNTMFVGYATTNSGTFQMLPEDWQNDPVYWASDEEIARSEWFRDLGPVRDEIDRVWTEVWG